MHKRYYLYRLKPEHKWRVSATPPSEALLHELTSPTRKAAIVRRTWLNAVIEGERQAEKKFTKKIKKSGNPAGRPPTGNAKVRVVLTVPPDVAAAIPGNRNEYGNRALRETLKKDGLI